MCIYHYNVRDIKKLNCHYLLMAKNHSKNYKKNEIKINKKKKNMEKKHT